MSNGHWTDMFEPRRPGHIPGDPPPPPARFDDADVHEVGVEANGYAPWTLVRGPGRPTMLLHLRRYDPRSGMWIGWALSYPTLSAVEYVGSRMLTLDFGERKFAVEGDGLDALVERLQSGAVVSIQEYSAQVWPSPTVGSIVTAIRRLGMSTP